MNGEQDRSGPRGQQEDTNQGPPAGKPPRWRSALAWVVVAPWLALLAAWLVGRVVGDRTLWTQYLEWIPTEAVALSGLVTALAARLVRGRRARRPLAVLVLSAAAVLWLVGVEWTLWRAVLPRPTPGETVRVVFQNISPSTRPADILPVFDAGGDIVVLSNVHPQPITFEKIYGIEQEDLLELAVGITPGSSPPGDVHMLRATGHRFLSRWPIRRWASATVGEQETWLEDDVLGSGQVIMAEIETPGGPLIVWAVDMPRTLGASRRVLFEEARARVDAVERVRLVDGIGRWIHAPREPGDPLFEPDIVVGDFNTPGHAWSVRRFLSTMRPARADAGLGPAGTWPHVLPLFEIDLAELGPRVRAAATGRVRGADLRHLGVWVDLTR